MSTPPTTNGVASEIRKLDWDNLQQYRVEWKSAERWDFDAVYSVEDIRHGEGGKPMIELKGPKGGDYLIDSNPMGRPRAKHLRPDGYTSSDRLAELRVYGETVKWHNQLLRMIVGVTGQIKQTGD